MPENADLDIDSAENEEIDEQETDLEENENEDENSESESDDSEKEPGEEELGDKGKKALASMKAKLKAEKTKRLAAEKRASDAESGDDDDAAKQQRAADEAAFAKANARIVKAEVRAAAGGKLADPLDALNFIDLDQFDVDEDGDVDQEEIAEAIADLLKKKPYLAAQSGGPKTPKPDRSQGARGKGGRSTADQFSDAMGSFFR